jgi:hypothetical protein
MAHRVRFDTEGAAGEKDACSAMEWRVWDSNGRNVHAQLQIARRWGLEEVVVRISLIRAERRGMQQDPERLERQGFR